MVEMLHADGGRVIIRLADGKIVTVRDADIEVKLIPGRRKAERKRVDWDDFIVVNDALKKIFPNMREAKPRSSEKEEAEKL